MAGGIVHAFSIRFFCRADQQSSMSILTLFAGPRGGRRFPRIFNMSFQYVPNMFPICFLFAVSPPGRASRAGVNPDLARWSVCGGRFRHTVFVRPCIPFLVAQACIFIVFFCRGALELLKKMVNCMRSARKMLPKVQKTVRASSPGRNKTM